MRYTQTCHLVDDIALTLFDFIYAILICFLLKVRFAGFGAIRAGLQAETYLDAMLIEKNKLGYTEVVIDEESKSQVADHHNL